MEWIKCSEKIPEENKEVLVWDENAEECQIRYRLNETYPGHKEDHNTIAWNGQGICNEIKYWMPLPEAPKD